MPKNDLAKTMVVGAASWSFKANCKQHKAVRDFAEKMSKDDSLPEKKRSYLVGCVQYADGNT